MRTKGHGSYIPLTLPYLHLKKYRQSAGKTETLLLQGFSEEEKKLFADFLMRAGKNITAELHIERKEEEFND